MSDHFAPPLILYDNECLLCCRFKDALKRIPGCEQFQFVPIQNEEVFKQYPQLNPQSCQQELHLLDKELNIYAGGDAIRFLIRQFPVVSRLAWLVENQMGRKVSDFFYDIANKYHARLKNRCPTCKKN